MLPLLPEATESCPLPEEGTLPARGLGPGVRQSPPFVLWEDVVLLGSRLELEKLLGRLWTGDPMLPKHLSLSGAAGRSPGQTAVQPAIQGPHGQSVIPLFF